MNPVLEAVLVMKHRPYRSHHRLVLPSVADYDQAVVFAGRFEFILHIAVEPTDFGADGPDVVVEKVPM
jgi:hypothetical protein